MSRSTSALMCGHANEAPARPCDCPVDCYCKVDGGCKRIRRNPVIGDVVSDGAGDDPKPRFITVYGTMSEDHDGTYQGAMAYFSSYTAAEGYGVGKGLWGGNAGVKSFSAIQLGDGSVYIITGGAIDLDRQKSNYEEELRKRTLAKLTPEEQRVLGLDGMNDREK